MSGFEQKNMSGALFKNKNKRADNHPDYTGNCTVEGKKLNIAAWLKTSGKGEKYMSISFSEPQTNGGGSNTTQSRPNIEDSDDIPF